MGRIRSDRACLHATYEPGHPRLRTRGARWQGGLWWLEWHPQVINVGQTPAYDVDVSTRVDIMPDPIPPDKDLEGPLKDLPQLPASPVSRTTIGTGQDIYPTPYLGRIIADSELQELKQWGTGTAVYVWGTVIYKDIFREKHRTNFCQMAIWDSQENLYGRYTDRHNEAD
jgi:hypothetical protein